MLSTFDYSWTTKAATQPVGIKKEKKEKRRDDKEKRYGSHMAGWGERSLGARAAEPGGGACEAISERSRLNSSSPPSSTLIYRAKCLPR